MGDQGRAERQGCPLAKLKKVIMCDEQRQFLSVLGQPPARLTVEQVGWGLNFQPYEILALVTLRLLKPIGDPEKNATKLFWTQEILELGKDKAWLTKATNALYKYRNKRNLLQKSRRINASQANLFTPVESPPSIAVPAAREPLKPNSVKQNLVTR